MSKTKQTPKRIQRKRTKGWRMPSNTVSVTRPGRFGNPFTDIPLPISLALFCNMVQGVWSCDREPVNINALPAEALHDCYTKHHAWIARLGGHPLETICRELRGKNLACFCPLDQPCHADILLKLANQ